MMQSLGRKYVRYFNTQYQRTGTLWEGRFKSNIIDSERYLLTVYRYIELNPVRAEMVSHASEYPWSSYQHNGVGKNINIITPHEQYMGLGSTSDDRQRAYRGLFKGFMPELEIQEIRAALKKEWVLGDEHFKKMIERKIGVIRNDHGGDRKSLEFLQKSSTLTP